MYATPKPEEVDIWTFKVDNMPTTKKGFKLSMVIASNLLTLLLLILNDKTMNKFFHLIILYATKAKARKSQRRNTISLSYIVS